MNIQFETIVRNSPDLIIRVNSRFELVYINNSMEKEFGIPSIELIGKPIKQLNQTNGYSTKWESAVKTVFSTKEETSLELLQPSPHGFKYFHIRLVPELDETGVVGSVLSIGRNITQVKDAENQRCRLFNASADMLSIFDLRGSLLNFNPAWERILGYASEELFSQSYLYFLHPDDIHSAKAILKKCLKDKVIIGYEARYRCKDGSYKWLSWNCTPLVAEGVIHAVARDITERKIVENRLRQSEERYRLLVESSPDGMVMVSGGKIKYANPAAAKLVKLDSPEELNDRVIFDFIHHEEYQRIKDSYDLYNQQGSSLIELELLDVKGDKISVEVSPLPMPYDDKIAVICMIRDITSRKRNEELQRAIAEKEKKLKEALELDKLRTEFFSNISHEFKTPLNVILGTLQLIPLYLKDKSLKPLEKKLIKKINTMKQNCYRLLRLVNNLIDINKIDAGYFEINRDNHDIVKIIKEITISVKDYIENKEITFNFKTNIKEKVIACDPDKIERIMLNLLSNAIKHTDAGGYISVTMKSTEEKVYISVKDTGTGISKDKLDIIFERFSQVDESLIRKNQGSGIGLALVKSLVEMHKGRVAVKSEIGKGTEFIIELPIEQLSTVSAFSEEGSQYGSHKQIEKINIEFSDIYFQKNAK